MKLFARTVLAFAASIIVGGASAAPVSDCVYLLTHPVFKTETINQSAASKSDFRLLQCSANWHNHQDAEKAGIGATVPIYGIPVTFSGSYDQNTVDSWKNVNCSNEERSSDYKSTLYKSVYEIDPIVAKAFVDCEALAMKATGSALSCDTTETMSSVVFEASWQMSPGELPNAAPVIQGLSVVGASCSQPLASGSKIPQGGVSMLCTLSQNESPVFVLNTSRGQCVSQGSGQVGDVTLHGQVTLSQPTTYSARTVTLASDLVIVTNGWPLTIQAHNLNVTGSPQIVSYLPAAVPDGQSGRNAAQISISAVNLSGSGLSILNAGEVGGKGAKGGKGPTGPKGARGAGVSWTPWQGCHGGTNGNPGGQGGPGFPGQSGLPGGAAGQVTLNVPDWNPVTPAILVRTDVDLLNHPAACNGMVCGGPGGPGGDGGDGGDGGEGGDGASGNATCGGTSGGPRGPGGPQGQQGPVGPAGQPAQVRIF